MNVIVALDDSPHSHDVVSAVTRRSWPEYTQFKILTVVEPIESFDDFDVTGAEFKAQREKAADKFCGSIREQLETSVPGSIVHYEVKHGSPAAEIINAAVEWPAELVVVGAHGQRGCPTNLMGSVSRAVAHHAPCSIEIVRSKSSANAKSKTKVAAGAACRKEN
jgi:nucleotide-binding universal stress UspA family protein